MCPTDIIKPEEVPEKWGLIYVNEKRKIKVIKNPYKESLTKSKFDKINTENERYLLTRWLSKTENPEKVIMMLRETNNHNTRLAKNISELKEANNALKKYERLFTRFERSLEKVNLSSEDIITEVSEMRDIVYFIQEYSKNQDQKTLDYIIKKANKL